MKKIVAILTVLLVPSLASAATLSLSPSSQSVNVGDTFTVSINLDTQGASIDGVDLRYLNYNSSMLQLQDANTSVSGVQVAPGTLMPMTLANSADTGLGRVTFSQVALGGSKYKGSGTLATLTFKALSTGTANISFNYTSGVTTDSNVASAGSDVLTAVVNGSYTIGSGSLSGNTNTNTTTSGASSSSGGGGGNGSVGDAVNPVVTTVGGQLLRNLFQGLSGDDVKVLQNFLVSKGYLTADNVTGFFGPVTQAAVQSFQRASNIVSSGTPLSTGYGSVGPTTRARINQLLGGGSTTGFASTLTPAQVAAIKAQILVLQQQVLQLLIKLQALQASGL